MEECTRQLIDQGRKPYFVSPAGCCLEGTYAFVNAFNELHAQMLERGHSSYDIVLTGGTGSTYAGIRITADPDCF
ncbi:MAG: hypothetical protein JW860_09825 [Sedimentisphaerales bacterium]|nr:hypothetical protein [Sedimentisphaerales bacterium]